MSDSFLKDKFPSMSDSDWVIVAFRYYVGRMTISAYLFAEDLARAWGSLPVETQEAIKLELEPIFKMDDQSRASGSTHHPLGMDMDRVAWELVRKAYTK